MALTAGAISFSTQTGHAIPGSVARAVATGAKASGGDFSYLLAQAGVESSYRPDLKSSTSSATGLFQFIESTWLDMVYRHGGKHGLGAEQAAITKGESGKLSVADPALRQHILDLRKDPELSARMAGELAAQNGQRLEKALGRAPDDTELYMAHFLGGGGAVKFLTAMQADPDQSATALMPAAARANPGIFKDQATGQSRSLAEVHAELAARMGRHDPKAQEADLVAGMSDPQPIRKRGVSMMADPNHAAIDGRAIPVTPKSLARAESTAPAALPGAIARLSPLTSWLLAQMNDLGDLA